MLTYSSPRLIGVSPVLLRLLVPRHPPCALIHLTNKTLKALVFDVVVLLLFSFQGAIREIHSLKTEQTIGLCHSLKFKTMS